MKILIGILLIFMIALLVIMGLAGAGGAIELLVAGLILIFLIGIGNLYFSHGSSQQNNSQPRNSDDNLRKDNN